VVFLARGASLFVKGRIIDVDGGRLASIRRGRRGGVSGVAHG